VPLRLLGRGLTETESDINRLGKLLEPGFPVAIQQAAVDSLRRLREPLVAEVLLLSWNGSSPTVRPLIFTGPVEQEDMDRKPAVRHGGAKHSSDAHRSSRKAKAYETRTGQHSRSSG